jgi:hypothetical protein
MIAISGDEIHTKAGAIGRDAECSELLDDEVFHGHWRFLRWRYVNGSLLSTFRSRGMSRRINARLPRMRAAVIT